MSGKPCSISSNGTPLVLMDPPQLADGLFLSWDQGVKTEDVGVAVLYSTSSPQWTDVWLFKSDAEVELKKATMELKPDGPLGPALDTIPEILSHYDSEGYSQYGVASFDYKSHTTFSAPADGLEGRVFTVKQAGAVRGILLRRIVSGQVIEWWMLYPDFQSELRVLLNQVHAGSDAGKEFNERRANSGETTSSDYINLSYTIQDF